MRSLSVSGARQVGVPLLGMVVSVYAVRSSSLVVWGQFSGIFLWLMLAEQVCGWGGQGLLLKQSAARPGSLHAIWWSWLVARAPLLGLMLLVAALMPLTLAHKSSVCLWLVASYGYRSFEFLVTWRKAFAFTLWAESLGTLAILVGLWAWGPASALLLLQLFAAAALLKLCLGLLWFRPFPVAFGSEPRWRLLAQGFWFFLPGFLGLVHGRIDLYAVALLMDAKSLGTYQLLSNLLVQGQGVAMALLAPFLKAYFRANGSLQARYLSNAYRWGGLCSPLLALSIYGIMRYVYGASMSLAMVLLAALYLFPFFVYLLHIQQLMRHEGQRKVAVVAALSILFHGGMNLVSIPLFGLSGALLAAACSQVLVWWLYQRATRAYAKEASRC